MADPKARLDEFDIEEVSAVDRAANGETFIVVKNDAGEAPMTTQADAPADKADGSGTTADASGTAPDSTAGAPAPDAAGAGAGTVAGTEKMSGAPTHMALMEEMAAAMRATTDAAVSAALESGDFDAAMRHLDTLWSLLYAMRNAAAVVNVLKADETQPSPFLAVEKACVDAKAEVIAKMRAAPARTEKAAIGSEALAAVMAKLDGMDLKLAAVVEAQAKAQVTKSVADLAARVSTMERGIAAPSTAAATGGTRDEARKSDTVKWSEDLAQEASQST